MKRKILTLMFFCLLYQFDFGQNVGINPAGTTPNTSAILDLNTGNTYTSPNGKGLLIPNVSLNTTADNTTVPVGASQQSMLVYNTNNAITGTGAGGKGYYWWDNASGLWINLMDNLAPTPAWLTTGNSGTTVGTNFLGTTDNTDLMFKVNSIKGGLIDIANNQTHFGYAAGLSTTGAQTSFFGTGAGQLNVAGLANTGMGYDALVNNVSGNYNSAFGDQSLFFTTGSNNSALGQNAGYSINSGANNTALGYYAMNNGSASNISSSYNTSIGSNSGVGITTGGYNSFLGYSSNMAAGTYTNATAIGSYAYAGESDALILGSIAGVNSAANSTKIGIGTTTPAVRLAVNGSGTNVYNTDIWVENNMHVQGNEALTQGGSRGRLRVGSAWGYSGLYADASSTGAANDLILGSSNSLVRVGPASGGQNLRVSGLESTGNRMVMADLNGTLFLGAGNNQGYGANIQSVKLASAQKTNSSSFVDITGMSITFTPVHNTVYVFVSVAGRYLTSGGVTTQGQAVGAVKVYNVTSGATVVTTANILVFTDYDWTGATITAGIPAIVGFPVTVTAGTSTTLKLQWLLSNSSGSGYFYCDPTSVDHCVFTIMD